MEHKTTRGTKKRKVETTKESEMQEKKEDANKVKDGIQIVVMNSCISPPYKLYSSSYAPLHSLYEIRKEISEKTKYKIESFDFMVSTLPKEWGEEKIAKEKEFSVTQLKSKWLHIDSDYPIEESIEKQRKEQKQNQLEYAPKFAPASKLDKNTPSDQNGEKRIAYSQKRKRTDDPTQGQNYLFYSNKISSKPDGDFIDVIHEKWFGDWEQLERHHGFIQWLFPLFEGGGMNMHSTPLQKGEAKLMRQDIDIAKRFIKSYRMMLDFYGMELLNEQTGEVARSKKWKERYAFLNLSSHNFLRITRILTSMGHLGFSRYKRPFLVHLKQEIQKGHFKRAADSLNNFWQITIDVDSPEFIEKTGETEEDREESIFFKVTEQPKGKRKKFI